MPDLDIIIPKHELAALLEERETSRKHITDLQARMSEMQEAQLSRRVRAFHAKFGHPTRTTPQVPPDDELRFRLKLIAEEFLELLNASLISDGDVTAIQKMLDSHIEHAPILVDFPAFIDALLDLAYVIEGAHAVAGVHADPAMAEVQRANMAKDAVYVQAKDGFHMGKTIKPVKPSDWAPPDIVGVLLAQGWRP